MALAGEGSGWNRNLADWLETAAPEITAPMEFPEGLLLRIRSNNLLDRFTGELLRRVRLAGIFPNSASLPGLITAMTIEVTFHAWALVMASWSSLLHFIRKVRYGTPGIF